MLQNVAFSAESDIFKDGEKNGVVWTMAKFICDLLSKDEIFNSTCYFQGMIVKKSNY